MLAMKGTTEMELFFKTKRIVDLLHFSVKMVRKGEGNIPSPLITNHIFVFIIYKDPFS